MVIPMPTRVIPLRIENVHQILFYIEWKYSIVGMKEKAKNLWFYHLPRQNIYLLWKVLQNPSIYKNLIKEIDSEKLIKIQIGVVTITEHSNVKIPVFHNGCKH